MKAWGYLLLILPLWLNAAEDLMIRAQFLSAQGYAHETDQALEPVVGERVTLAVDVLTKTWFTKAPRFPHLKIRDAINLKAQAFATNFSERIDGSNYAVQRREYTIFPQRAGQFVINGVEVDVWTADQNGTASAKRSLRSKPLLLLVQPLPARGSDPDETAGSLPATAGLVATGVQIEQSFSSALDQLKVGDVVERRVSIRASGTVGMLIPPIAWADVDGAKQRSLSTLVDDKINRGEFEGLRRETRQYTLLNEGDLYLPPLQLDWWDGQQWQLSELPEKILYAVKPGRYPELSRLSSWLDTESLTGFSWLKLVAMSCALITVIWAAAFIVKVTAVRLLVAAKRFQHSEAKFWLRLNYLVYFSSAPRVVTCFYRWRSVAEEPLQLVANDCDQLWSDWCAMAQQAQKPNYKARRGLAQMIRQMRDDDRLSSASGRRAVDGDLPSATVPLQALNPR